MKIGIAADHRGVLKKAKIIKYLFKCGYNIIDYGPTNNESVDYPDYAFLIGEKINEGEIEMGILICGSGIGMSIAANKVSNIRCAKVNNVREAKLSRLHNWANVLALSNYMNIVRMKDIIDVFLKTENSDEPRHLKRIEKINNYNEC